jgi:hypothetical protein
LKAAQHTSEKEKSRAAANIDSYAKENNVRAAFPAPATQTIPVAQRSTLTASMPGLGTDNSGANKRKRGNDKKDDKKQQPEKRVTRGSKAVYDLNRPQLTYTGAYLGVGTQQVNAQQRISFDQHAVLQRPAGAPQATDFYYNFRQEVRDGFASTPVSPTDHALGGGFVQDGPFAPPYNDPNITNAPAAIDFHDNPGFSNPSEIPAGDWLDWYEVRFQWLVSRADGGGNGGTWTSPEVTHRVDSVYNGGANAPIVPVSTPNTTWNVVIP